MTAHQALQQLLRHSGLEVVQQIDGSYRVRATPDNPSVTEKTLPTLQVIGEAMHPSQALMQRNQEAFEASRSASGVSGTSLHAMSPANKGDALRYSVTGMISEPGAGNRFGSSTKIRTFGDWGAAESINGLPAFESAGGDGGGLSGTFIPSIALDSVNVLKGGRGVGYGNGTDGGVVNYGIKSGRNFEKHRMLSFDASSVGELKSQVEAADHTSKGDYYLAASSLQARYGKEPSDLDRQSVGSLLGNFGWNFTDAARGELLVIHDANRPDIVRKGAIETIHNRQDLISGLLDVSLSPTRSVRLGYLNTNSQTQWPARKRDRSIHNNIAFANHHLALPLSSTTQYNGTLGLELKKTDYLRDHQWNNTFLDTSFKTENTFVFDKNLTLNAGARLVHFNNDIVFNNAAQPNNLKDDSVLAYELGASWNALKDTRLRTSLATGYNRFIGKYGNFGTDALSPLGVGDDIVESRSMEIGVRQNIPTGYVDLAIYDIRQSGVPRRNGGAIESMTVNQRGLELELASELTPQLTLRSGFTHMLDLHATRANGAAVNGNIFWDGQTTSVPKNQLFLRLNHQLSSQLELWGAAFYSSGYEAVAADDSVVKREGFTRLDLGVLWNINKRWQLRAHVENLTDERHFGSRVQGVPVPDEGKVGRVYWLGLNIALP